MIEAARRLDRSGGRVEYVRNDEPSLARFADRSFDLVYSNLVLQHMPEELGRGYVAELARVLRPGGLLVFQAPAERAPLPRLPRSAVIAEIEPLQAGVRVPAGAKAVVRARVRNASRAWWSPVRGPQMVYFANHWLAADGRLLVQDDGRAPLPGDVGPGAVAELAVEVTAPAEPGRYLLELDLVQQDVAWFSERRKLSRRRTRTGRVEVEVGGAGFDPPELDPATQPPVDAEPDDETRMEMHAIPQAAVVAAVEGAGARILRAEDDPRGALGWRTLLYWATK
jgi:SAM-dependent methyltransferase